MRIPSPSLVRKSVLAASLLTLCSTLSGCATTSAPTDPQKIPGKAPTASTSTAPTAAGPVDLTPVWMPVKIEKDCRAGKITIPAGDYHMFPILEDEEGQRKVKKCILASRTGVKPEEVNAETGKAADGTFAVIILMPGMATMKDTLPATRSRYASDGKIVSLWLGFSGDNREFVSEPLQRVNPDPDNKPAGKR